VIRTSNPRIWLEAYSGRYSSRNRCSRPFWFRKASSPRSGNTGWPAASRKSAECPTTNWVAIEVLRLSASAATQPDRANEFLSYLLIRPMQQRAHVRDAVGFGDAAIGVA